MFYKITNKESELYKKLHELRTNERKIDKENNAAVKQLVGDDWDHFSGWEGQQNFHRVTMYSGFAFKHPENLQPKTWKKHKEYEDIYVPDRRTKNGRAIAEALDDLPHSSSFMCLKFWRWKCLVGLSSRISKSATMKPSCSLLMTNSTSKRSSQM